MARSTKYFAKNLAHKDEPPSELEVEALGQGRYAVTLDGHTFELDSLVLPHGAVSMIVEGQSFSVEFAEKGDKVGDVVTEGQGLVVVEAMKMENELKAPKAGTVTEIITKEGATVENGAPLLVVE